MPAYCAPAPETGTRPGRHHAGCAGNNACVRLAASELCQAIGDRTRRCADDRNAVREVRASGIGGEAHISHAASLIVPRAEGVFVSMRQHPQALSSRAESARIWAARSRQLGRPVLADGASSRITCALVPLKPNELTPATRRPSIGSTGYGPSEP